MGEYTGLLITAGSAVLVALIGGILAIVAKNRPTPVPINDVWDENREMRRENSEMRVEIRTLQDAFGILFHWVERAASDWNQNKPMPTFSEEERIILEKVRASPAGTTEPVQ